MNDDAVARDELDRHFTEQVAAAERALAQARQQQAAWRTTGTHTAQDALAAWKTAASRATAAGDRIQAEFDRAQALRRWLISQGYWPNEQELPAEVEVALRLAIRAGARV